jgi:hypothetical protein
VDDLLKNNIGLQVLTDTGWSNFAGLLLRGSKQTLVIKTTMHNIVCTLDHKFYKPNLEFVEAGSLRPRHKIRCSDKIDTVVSVTLAKIEPVYDLLEVEKNHRFYANGILVKNCEFLIYDETLINSIMLAELGGIEPAYRQGQVRWYKRPKRGHTYIVALDPSLGTGGDPAAIQVLELPGCLQVGEWQHNKTRVQQQIVVLRDICQHIMDEIGSSTDIYYSVENNTLGEAALISISQMGEENIPGIFLSEPKKGSAGHKYRKGFTTTHKSKIAACAKFKNMLETKKMTISSSNTISELKTFVAAGTGFAAKVGETDDLVMSMLLAIRMIQALQNYDSNLDAKLRDTMDDIIMPMPFIMV